MTINKQPLASSGAGYFFKGIEILQTKGLRRFVVIPLLVNLVLFSLAFYYLYTQLDHYMALLLSWLPSWLDWLSSILWPLAIITIVISFSFIFSAGANWIAAPFNGLLAEKVEQHLSGQQLSDESFVSLIKDIPRVFSRELSKFLYFLPRSIGFLLLYFFLPVIGQILWFAFLAWSMAVQYKDYPFDNHKIPFNEMRSALSENKGLSYSFGLTVVIVSMIPIINLIVMPVAICGATAIWVDHYQQKYSLK